MLNLPFSFSLELTTLAPPEVNERWCNKAINDLVQLLTRGSRRYGACSIHFYLPITNYTLFCMCYNIIQKSK